MDGPSTFLYGRIVLLSSKDRSVRCKWPLIKPSCTFGRDKSSDCRILDTTISQQHAEISIALGHPYEAMLKVTGLNGVLLNGEDCPLGTQVQLHHNDEIIMRKRIFIWESALNELIFVDSPSSAQHRVARLPLAETKVPSTPSKGSLISFESPAPPSASLLGSLLSPLRSLSSGSIRGNAEPFLASQESVGPSSLPAHIESQERDFAPSSESVRGPDEDLITWEEIEEEPLPGCSDSEEKILSKEDDGNGSPSQSHKPTTPIPSSKTFHISSTPDLANRPRTLREPASAAPAPRSAVDRHVRRRSMRMTIIPAEHAIDFKKAREDNKIAVQQNSPARVHRIGHSDSISSPKFSTNPSVADSTPRRHSSSAMLASPHSSTSRRISALLLSSEVQGATLESSSEQVDNDDSSDEENDNVELQSPVTAKMNETIAPISIMGSAADSSNEQIPRQLLTEPSSPQGPTPIASKQVSSNADSAVPSSPARWPLTRRLSLREKVLIRGAIKSTVPIADNLKNEKENIQQAAIEPPAAHDHSLLANAKDATPIKAAGVKEATPNKVQKSPYRDSIELTRSRSETSEKREGFTPIVLSSDHDAVANASDTEEDEKSPVPDDNSPTPASRNFRSLNSVETVEIKTPVRLEKMRLPTRSEWTPSSFTPKLYAPAPPPQTPVAGALAAIFGSPAVEGRDEFESEMTSPVTQHRIMATPRSVLRTYPSKKKAYFGLRNTPPTTTKRKVIFNEEVYIQEIVDIRDKRLHWDAALDGEAQAQLARAASIPLPETPAHALLSQTPVTNINSAARRAQRVPTSTPAESVRKALFNAQQLINPELRATSTPRRVPISPTKGKQHPPSESLQQVPSFPSRAPEPENASQIALSTFGRQPYRPGTGDLMHSGGGNKVPGTEPRPRSIQLPKDLKDFERRSSMPSKYPRTDLTGRTVFTPTAASKSILLGRAEHEAKDGEKTKEQSQVTMGSVPNRTVMSSRTTSQSNMEIAASSKGFQNVNPSSPAITPSKTQNLIGEKHAANNSAAPSTRTPNYTGVRELYQQSAGCPTPRYAGIRKLLQEPTSHVSSPQLIGIKSLLQPAAVVPATPNFVGVSDLFYSEALTGSPISRSGNQALAAVLLQPYPTPVDECDVKNCDLEAKDLSTEDHPSNSVVSPQGVDGVKAEGLVHTPVLNVMPTNGISEPAKPTRTRASRTVKAVDHELPKRSTRRTNVVQNKTPNLDSSQSSENAQNLDTAGAIELNSELSVPAAKPKRSRATRTEQKIIESANACAMPVAPFPEVAESITGQTQCEPETDTNDDLQEKSKLDTVVNVEAEAAEAKPTKQSGRGNRSRGNAAIKIHEDEPDSIKLPKTVAPLPVEVSKPNKPTKGRKNLQPQSDLTTELEIAPVKTATRVSRKKAAPEGNSDRENEVPVTKAKRAPAQKKVENTSEATGAPRRTLRSRT